MNVKNLTYDELFEIYVDKSTELAHITGLIVKLTEEQADIAKLFNEVNEQIELLENLEESKTSTKN